MFQRNIMPQTPTLKMEAICSSETLVPTSPHDIFTAVGKGVYLKEMEVLG
jgi:hypothetical protein